MRLSEEGLVSGVLGSQIRFHGDSENWQDLTGGRGGVGGMGWHLDNGGRRGIIPQHN